MFKTLRTNRNEILSYGIGLILFFALLYYGKTYFPPLAYVLSFGYQVMIAGLVFFSPWFFIRITMPNTMGKFINEWFEAAWAAMGKPSSFRISRSGRNIPPEEAYPAEPFLHAGELQHQLRLTLAVYAILVLAGALIAIAAFSQGISIPVFGG
jgi:hypothetical protein